MNLRFRYKPCAHVLGGFAILAAIVAAAIHGCESGLATGIVDRFYTLALLPPENGASQHTVLPGGSIIVRIELRMGVNVRGDNIRVFPPAPSSPVGLTYSGDSLGLIFIDNLEAEESGFATIPLVADQNAAPGTRSVTVETSVDVHTPTEVRVGDNRESLTFNVIILDPNADNNGGTEPPSTCMPLADFSGEWMSAYECTNGCGESFQGNEVITVTQTGASVTMVDDAGGEFTGTVCGNVITWTGMGDGFTESGTWTLDAFQTVRKASHYENLEPIECADGDCTATIVR
jgi:hypothetical protein